MRGRGSNACRLRISRGGMDATNSRDAEGHAMMMREGRVLCRYHVMRRFICVDTTAF